ncbi:D-hexose-6-phosphate mutarotase [Photobacterium atrarenae]|uniref:Putative glucose-6-phosphate 1-epimerase n=1 Tax=Photobacterium atrarenae TaxID=865757 RepID=A0ABY5GCQ2_9GAMM|nr:D-hexose-6-phosphate mutarotase [Photobacterium atrarenae]UTV26894.1 D-hexose-6-phosphate mutarotase [Photobacterium atrarenae]
MDLRNLSTISVLSDAITVCEYQGLKVLRVSHPQAEAAISLHGGHLICYQPTDEQAVIWLSEKAEFDHQKAIRGGIPVCWPWFGKAAAPSHGFARLSEWHLQEHRENETGVMISLRLEDSDATRTLWPHKFQNLLTFEIGRELRVSLTTTNTDSHHWSYSGALHTYFTVADIRDTLISGMGKHFLDSTQGNIACEGEKELHFSGETDRVYTSPKNPITIHDRRHQRQVQVSNEGHDSAVIWNPWQALSTSMTDMADTSFETMVCVEAAIHEFPVELAPGQSHTLSTQVRVQRN